jgi:hypothetical protein
MVILYTTTFVICSVVALLAAIASVERNLVSIIINGQRLAQLFKNRLLTQIRVNKHGLVLKNVLLS